MAKLEQLAIRLPDLTGSPLSINSLREDLQASHKTVSTWLNVLERLYGFFRVQPFGSPIIRAVKKEQKHYHYDWTLVIEDAYRFENLVGVHLLKWVSFLQDSEGRELELRYFRDIDGREVDFVVLENGKPIQFVECKWQKGNGTKSLKYLVSRFPGCADWQITAVGSEDYVTPEGIRVCPARLFLKDLV